MIKGVVEFLEGVKQEFLRVIWPSKQELVGTTIVVLLLMVAYAIYLGVVDFIFARAAAYVF